MGELANRLNLNDIISEFDIKTANIDAAIEKFQQAKSDFIVAAIVSGGMPGESIDTEYPSRNQLLKTIRHSAWDKLYKISNLDMVLTAKDKDKFMSSMANPPEFTKENIIATFGDHILNPRQSILRGLAEVFSGLDPYYRSHEKVKIGVKGIPKRVIISGVTSFFWQWQR